MDENVVTCAGAGPARKITLLDLGTPDRRPTGEPVRGSGARKFLGAWTLPALVVTLRDVLAEPGRLQDGDVVVHVPRAIAENWTADRFLVLSGILKMYRIIHRDAENVSNFVEIQARAAKPAVEGGP